jgi:hypothetical protein
MNYFGFLKSSRFHSLVGIAVLLFLESIEVLAPGVTQPLLVILSGHIGIRTVDRFAEEM